MNAYATQQSTQVKYIAHIINMDTAKHTGKLYDTAYYKCIWDTAKHTGKIHDTAYYECIWDRQRVVLAGVIFAQDMLLQLLQLSHRLHTHTHT